MILIDLNKYHWKVVNNGQVWTHGLDELQTIVILDEQEMANVGKGREIAKMPLAKVCKWLFPVGKASVDHCLNRRNPPSDAKGSNCAPRLGSFGVYQKPERKITMNQIVNMSRYRNRQILASEFGDNYMYCGWGNRRLGLVTSPLANPYTDKSNARANRIRVANRDEAVEMYRVWLWERICEQDQAVLGALHQITPTTALVCWCAPKRCHCEVIAKAAAWIEDVTKFTYQIIEHGLASWAADGASGVCDFTTIEDLRKEVFSCLLSSRFL